MRRRRVRYDVDKTGRPFPIKTRRGAVKSSVLIEPIRGQSGLGTRLTDRVVSGHGDMGSRHVIPGPDARSLTRSSRVRGNVGRIEPASLAGAFCRERARPRRAQRDRCRFHISERGISDAAKGTAAAVAHRAAARRPVRSARPSDGSDVFPMAREAHRITGSWPAAGGVGKVKDADAEVLGRNIKESRHAARRPGLAAPAGGFPSAASTPVAGFLSDDEKTPCRVE